MCVWVKQLTFCLKISGGLVGITFHFTMNIRDLFNYNTKVSFWSGKMGWMRDRELKRIDQARLETERQRWYDCFKQKEWEKQLDVPWWKLTQPLCLSRLCFLWRFTKVNGTYPQENVPIATFCFVTLPEYQLTLIKISLYFFFWMIYIANLKILPCRRVFTNFKKDCNY